MVNNIKNMIITIIISTLIIFLFIGNTISISNNNRNDEIKNILNRSCKVVADSIDIEEENIEHIADGYMLEKRNSIKIDLNRLDNLFESIIKYNSKIINTEDIKLKIVVYDEQFFIQDKRKTWIPKYLRDDDKILNIFDDQYHNLDSEITYSLPKNYDKEEIIINQINKVIKSYMKDIQNSYSIGIKNTKDINLKNKNFNVLNGVTFFVLYIENEPKLVGSEIIKNRKFSVAGYTLNTIAQEKGEN